MLAWTDTSKDTPPKPASPANETDESTPRDSDLPIPSRMAIPDNHELNDDNNDKDKKIEGRDILVKEAG